MPAAVPWQLRSRPFLECMYPIFSSVISWSKVLNSYFLVAHRKKHPDALKELDKERSWARPSCGREKARRQWIDADTAVLSCRNESAQRSVTMSHRQTNRELRGGEHVMLLSCWKWISSGVWLMQCSHRRQEWTGSHWLIRSKSSTKSIKCCSSLSWRRHQ